MKADIKETIIKAAQKTFQRYGFRKTTMDEIAYAARKGKSTLYYYFKSKEEVFEAVVELEASTLFNEINQAIKHPPTAKEKIYIYIFKRMNGFKNLGNLYEAIKDEYLSTIEFIEKIRKKYDADEIAMLKSIIQGGIDDKEFKKMDVNLTAKTLAIAMKGLEIPVLLEEREDTDFKTEINDMLDILFYGMCIS